MLSFHSLVPNVDAFIVHKSILYYGVGNKIYSNFTNSTIFEYNFTNLKNRISGFISWNDFLVFFDAYGTKRLGFKNGQILPFEFHITRVLDDQYCLIENRDKGTMELINYEQNIVWERNFISYVISYCDKTELLFFIKKGENDVYQIKAIDKKTGSDAWTSDFPDCHYIGFSGHKNGRLYLNIIKDTTKPSLTYILECNSGKILDIIDRESLGAPRINYQVQYDRSLNRLVSHLYELDLDNHEVHVREYFRETENRRKKPVVSNTAVWNDRYYLDIFRKESDAYRKIVNPYEFLVFDRINDTVVDSIILEGNKDLLSIGIKKLELHHDKLYAHDCLNNLRIYDFSEFADAQS